MKRSKLWRRILLRQAWQSKSSYVTFAVCLAVALFITQLSADLTMSERTRIFHLYGYQHGVFVDCSDTVLHELAGDPRVASLGVATIAGIARNPTSDPQNSVTIGSMDPSARTAAGLELEEGRWPEKEGEIVLERSALYILRVRAELGETISLSVEQPSGSQDISSKSEAKSFCVVGILKNYSYMHYHPEETGSSGSGLPGIILSDVSTLIQSDRYPRFAFVRVLDDIPYVPFFRELAARHDMPLNQYYLNTAAYPPDAALEVTDGNTQVNHSAYFPDGDSAIGYESTLSSAQRLVNVVGVMLFGLVVMLFITTILMLRHKQAESVLRLRLAGASARQLVASTVLQAFFALLVLVPAGIGISILLCLLADRTYLRDRIPYFTLGNHGSLLLWTLFIFLLLLVSGIAYSRAHSSKRRPLDTEKKLSESDAEPTSRDTQVRTASKKPNGWKEKRPLLLWAFRSYGENRAALSGVAFALALSIAIVLGNAYLIQMLRQNNAYTSRFDIELTNSATSFFSSFKVPAMQNRFEEEDLIPLLQSNEILSAHCLSRYYINLVEPVPTEHTALLSSLGFMDSEDPTLTDPILIAEQKKTFGYGEEEQVFTGSVLGLEAGMLESLRPYVVAGAIDTDALLSGEQVLLLSGDETIPAQVGSFLTLTQMIDPAGSTRAYSTNALLNIASTDWVRKDVVVRIGAVVRPDLAESSLPIQVGEGSSIIAWGNTAFRHFGLAGTIESVRIQMIDYRDDAKVRAEIERLDMLYPAMHIKMRSESERQEQLDNNIVLASAYGLMVLTALFSLFTIYSFSQTLAVRNRRLIGALRAGGLSLDRMRRLKLLDSVLLMTIAIVVSHVIGLGFAMMIQVSNDLNGKFKVSQILDVLRFYPVVPMLVLIPVLYGLVYLFQMAPIRRLYRLPVCELIREE